MRKPLEVIRADATGFKKKSVLDSISTSAMEETWKASRKPRSPVVKADQPAAPGASEPAPQSIKSNVASVSDIEQQAEKPVVSTEKKPTQKPEISNEKLVRYVAPPAPSRVNNVSVSVTLRVLKRHADQLDRITEIGGDPEAILSKALASMVRPTYKPVFQPQVLEPSGSGKYSRRTSARIPEPTMTAIVSKVQNGDRLPRSRLIVGQVEVEWFKALEEAIEEASS